MDAVLTLASPRATARLGRALASHLRPGDTLALAGRLGAGKSLLARALIAHRLDAAGRAEEIPSPSYTLVQTYDLGDALLWHADLYRLGAPGEIVELGLEEAFETAITLIEWPERAGALLPDRRLTLTLDFAPQEDARRATLAAAGPGWDWLAGALTDAAR